MFLFDRTAFRANARRFVAGDLDVDLSGRVALVTGANAGLGRATAAGLARRGAEVWLLCRDPDRGEAARRELERDTGGRLRLAVLDMSSLEAVHRFVSTEAPPRVDVLVHNAGLLPDARRETPEGHELCWATHVLGPHALSFGLLDRLRASDDARVVWMSSGGMYLRRLRTDDVAWRARPYDGVLAYADTKRHQVVLAEEWAHRLSGTCVSVCAMHPGWADTRSVRTSLPRFHAVTERVLRSAEEGADTALWLAVAPGAGARSGRFFFDRAARPTHYLPWTRDRPGERERLWSLACEQADVPLEPAARRFV